MNTNENMGAIEIRANVEAIRARPELQAHEGCREYLRGLMRDPWIADETRAAIGAIMRARPLAADAPALRAALEAIQNRGAFNETVGVLALTGALAQILTGISDPEDPALRAEEIRLWHLYRCPA